MTLDFSEDELETIRGFYADAAERIRKIVLDPEGMKLSSSAFRQARAAQLVQQIRTIQNQNHGLVARATKGSTMEAPTLEIKIERGAFQFFKWAANSRKIMTALSTIVTVLLTHLLGHLGFSSAEISQINLCVLGVGMAVIAGVAHEDLGKSIATALDIGSDTGTTAGDPPAKPETRNPNAEINAASGIDAGLPVGNPKQ